MMGSDPQSFLQATEDAIHKKCRKRIAELEARVMPFGLYHGACGHYWDSTHVGIEKCPACEEISVARNISRDELAEERARLDYALEHLEIVRRDDWEVVQIYQSRDDLDKARRKP